MTDMPSELVEKVARAMRASIGLVGDPPQCSLDLAQAAIAALTDHQSAPRRWDIGDKVRKKRGSQWRGTVCGFYSTPHTPEGYCVDSAYEAGSVQVWPAAALEDWNGND